MKTNGRHPEKALSAVGVRAHKQPGRYADGNGLYLVVDPSGAKRWLLRTLVRGKRTDIGLGGLSLVSLAEAREKAVAFRKIARDGGDPLAERRKAREVLPTFAEAAALVHGEHVTSWRNKKHAAQWINTLEQYAFPVIGSMRVDQIETPDVLRVLSPIWLKKAETARRVRQRLGTVFDWAKAAGLREGDNPVTGIAKGLPKQPSKDGHHLAMPYAQLPGFIDRLRAFDSHPIVRLAFEFLLLTATRTTEALGAQWKEIDRTERLWTVPADRMKKSRLHRIPLSDRAFDLLTEAKALSGGSAYIFPGRTDDKPLSNMVFLMLLRRMEIDATVHGFRSSFRDWAAEQTNYPREVCEQALAHVVENKTEAAYRRGDLLEKRRELMADWAEFSCGGGSQR